MKKRIRAAKAAKDLNPGRGQETLLRILKLLKVSLLNGLIDAK